MLDRRLFLFSVIIAPTVAAAMRPSELADIVSPHKRWVALQDQAGNDLIPRWEISDPKLVTILNGRMNVMTLCWEAQETVIWPAQPLRAVVYNSSNEAILHAPIRGSICNMRAGDTLQVQLTMDMK